MVANSQNAMTLRCLCCWALAFFVFRRVAECPTTILLDIIRWSNTSAALLTSTEVVGFRTFPEVRVGQSGRFTESLKRMADKPENSEDKSGRRNNELQQKIDFIVYCNGCIVRPLALTHLSILLTTLGNCNLLSESTVLAALFLMRHARPHQHEDL